MRIKNAYSFLFGQTKAVAHSAWLLRQWLIAGAFVCFGIGLFYLGCVVLPLRPPQEVWYNEGLEQIRSDMSHHHSWQQYRNPDVPDLQTSLAYYQDQAHPAILERLLYGPPNDEYAAQANLKIGVILTYTANDEKDLRMAKEYLERAIKLNPGIVYNRSLELDLPTVDALTIAALAPERDLELLFQTHPEERTKTDRSDDPSRNNGTAKDHSDQDNKPLQSRAKKRGENPQGSRVKGRRPSRTDSDAKNLPHNDGI